MDLARGSGSRDRGRSHMEAGGTQKRLGFGDLSTNASQPGERVSAVQVGNNLAPVYLSEKLGDPASENLPPLSKYL